MKLKKQYNKEIGKTAKINKTTLEVPKKQIEEGISSFYPDKSGTSTFHFNEYKLLLYTNPAFKNNLCS